MQSYWLALPLARWDREWGRGNWRRISQKQGFLLTWRCDVVPPRGACFRVASSCVQFVCEVTPRCSSSWIALWTGRKTPSGIWEEFNWRDHVWSPRCQIAHDRCSQQIVQARGVRPELLGDLSCSFAFCISWCWYRLKFHLLWRRKHSTHSPDHRGKRP